MARFEMEKSQTADGSKIVSTTGRLSSSYSEASADTQNAILIAQANVVAEQQRKNAGDMLNLKGYGKGLTREAIRVSSPFVRGGARGIKIAFFGTRNGGRTRAAEVAFFNEFGIGDNEGNVRMSKRLFISKANESTADECAEIAADLFAAYVADQIQI